MADDRTRAPDPDDPGSTAPIRPISGAPDQDPTATRAFPAATGNSPGDTAPMAPVDEAGDARWSAKASVPPAGHRAAPEVWVDEPAGDPYAGRSWLAPVGIGIAVLVLLGVLGTGMYLILTSDDGDEPVAAPSATSAPPATSAAPTPSRTPSSAPPTSASPVPTTVEVPVLVGLPVDEARQRLADRGLRAETRREETTDAAPGTVVSSDPGPGEQVPQGSVVRLVVAAEPTPRPSGSAT